LSKDAIEIVYDERPYLIVPHHALLALVRPQPEDLLDRLEGLDDLESLP
jgi:hypothetical protein